MFRGIGSDLRYVLRVLRRSPAFTLVAIVSLGIGMGANTAMYGVIRTLLLAPIPVERPGQLAIVGWRREGRNHDLSQWGSTSYRDPTGGLTYSSSFSYAIGRAFRNASPRGVSLTAYSFLSGASISVGEQPAVLAGGVFADGNYFRTVRPGMELGRPLAGADDAPDAPLTVVLSHAFWLRAFGGDRTVIGRIIRVNGMPAQVVGVTRAGFRGLSTTGGFFPQTEITLPLSSQPLVYPRMSTDGSLFTTDRIFWLRLLVRVPDNVSRGTVASAYTAVLRALPGPASAGDDPPPDVGLLDGSRGAQPVRGRTIAQLYVLLGVVSAVLLIACMNLGSLMLARGVSRQREVAIRRALGSGRARLVRQNLLESLILAAAGTLLGLLLTVWARGLLSVVLASAFHQLDVHIGLDPVVLAGCAGLGVATTLLFGLLPAWRLARLDPASWLTQRTTGAAAPRLGVGRRLIGFQIAVSLPLVVGALLFLRTVSNMAAVPLGFDPTNLAMFQLDPGYTRLPEDQYPRVYQQVLANVRAIAGVRSATLLENELLSDIMSNTRVTIEGEGHSLHMNAVGPAFLETMGMRLVEGRMPGLQDTGDAPLVGVLNQAAVKELFGGVSPVGQLLDLGARKVRVIGVVTDSRYMSVREEVPPTLYDAALQRPGWGGHHIVMRTSIPLGRLEPAVREAVGRVNRDLPVPELTSQTAVLAQSTARERVFMQLLTVFGAFALLLASIGLYGITSYAVTRRTSEIGVRVALGARPLQVLWLVLRQVVVLSAAGLAAGVPLSLMGGRWVRSLLFGVAPGSPLVLVAASLLMLFVAVGAGLLPAWRAARLDPLLALRTE